MKRNIFKYLKRKINEHSTFSESSDKDYTTYKVECLGFTKTVSLMKVSPSSPQLGKSILMDKLVEDSDFLKKMEQLETREQNLRSLLD